MGDWSGFALTHEYSIYRLATLPFEFKLGWFSRFNFELGNYLYLFRCIFFQHPWLDCLCLNSNHLCPLFNLCHVFLTDHQVIDRPKKLPKWDATSIWNEKYFSLTHKRLRDITWVHPTIKPSLTLFGTQKKKKKIKKFFLLLFS